MIVPVVNKYGEEKGQFDITDKILYVPYYLTEIDLAGNFIIGYNKIYLSCDKTQKKISWEDVNNVLDSENEQNYVRTITTENGVLLNGYKFKNSLDKEHIIYYAYISKNIANEISIIDTTAFDASIKEYDENGLFLNWLKNNALHIEKYITRPSLNYSVLDVGSCETLTFLASGMDDAFMKPVYDMANDPKFKNVKNICLLERIDEDGIIRGKRKGTFLNESYSFDFFKDCKTYKEKKEKVIDFLKRGLITASFASMLFSFIAPNKTTQEALEREVIETIAGHDLGSENEDFKFGKFNDKTEFATDWKISKKGLEHIRNYEKFSATPYYVTPYDKENDIRTIGYGHKIKSTDPIELQNATSISKEDAEELFRSDIAKFERFFRVQIVTNLNKKLQNPETIPQALVDVIISMMYNAGNGNFRNEKINPFYTRLKNCRYDSQTGKINKQDYDYTIAAIKTSLVLHNNEKLKGLENRRQTEYKIAASAK